MIGNTDGLSGVSVDIRSYCSFFTSPAGGNWFREEIDIMMNPTQRSLYKKITKIERADYDYVITIFSGHGAESVNGTVLTLNDQKETIEIDDLANLSPRQLHIYDCCRNFEEMPFDTESGATKLSMSRDPIRQVYENRIQYSSPQEIILFACDESEKSTDTPSGGEYSQSLLRAIEMTLADAYSQFVSVSRAHYKAVSLMRQDNSIRRQHPQILQSRCLPNRRLPLAINPDF